MSDAAGMIDVGRLWDSLEASAAIGATPEGGLRRLALGDADGAMRDLFVRWCREAGCTVEVDRVGNIFARRAGMDDDLPAVAIGSHLDSQVAGGRFDGVLGVLAGLEVVRALDDHGVATRRPLDLVAWTNEEGARFQPPMMGSGVFAGVLDEEQVLAVRDAGALAVGDELRRIGYAGTAVPGARALDAYFELHIEQDSQLEEAGVDVGVVVGGYPARALSVVVTGETAHAGPTPMQRRRNALVGAAHAIAAVDRVGHAHAPLGKSCSTRIAVWPNVPGIVPSRAEVAIDLRHPDADALERMVAEVRAGLAQAADVANVEIQAREAWSFGGLRFDEGCVALVEQSAAALGYPHRRMLSQAGHDAYNVARVAPSAMIFCPCREGRSHHPAEDVDPARLAPSVEVLLHAVLARADR